MKCGLEGAIARMRLIDAARRAAPAPDSATFLESRPDLQRSDAQLACCSRDLLMWREARRGWTDPDRTPLS